MNLQDGTFQEKVEPDRLLSCDGRDSFNDHINIRQADVMDDPWKRGISKVQGDFHLNGGAIGAASIGIKGARFLDGRGWEWRWIGVKRGSVGAGRCR